MKVLALIFVLAVGALVFSGGKAPKATASGTDSAGTIALTCDGCGGVDGVVWAIRPDGHRIGMLFGATDTVRFSPDGKQIAYALGGRIYIHSLLGSRDVRVTSPPGNLNVSGDSDPAWVDAHTLVFIRARRWPPPVDNVTSLEAISTRGGHRASVLFATPPVQNPPNVTNPDVSRNGTIAFDDVRGNLWAMTLHGHRHLLASQGSLPRWSPDGTRVAFLLNEQQPAILDVRTGHVRIVTVSHDPQSGGALSWSPDAHRLAVAIGHDYNCNDPTGPCSVTQLWIVDLRTGLTHKVFTTPEGGDITSVDWTA